jgi:hypothetical protein
MTKKPTPPTTTYPPQLGAIKFQETPEGGMDLTALIAPARPLGAHSPVQALMKEVLDFVEFLKARARVRIAKRARAKTTTKTTTPAPKKGAKRAPNKKRR